MMELLFILSGTLGAAGVAWLWGFDRGRRRSASDLMVRSGQLIAARSRVAEAERRIAVLQSTIDTLEVIHGEPTEADVEAFRRYIKSITETTQTPYGELRLIRSKFKAEA